MIRCWVHIGMHKTGSTAIQRSFEKAVLPDGWKFLSVGGSSNMGGALYAMFATNPHRYHWFVRLGKTPAEVAATGAALRQQLAGTIRDSGPGNLIISGESLSLIDPEGIRRFKDFLDALCDEVRIVGYVRAPLAFKMSFFQQRLRHSDCPFDFQDFSPTYRSRFKKFDIVFGKQNVHLKKFSPDSLEDSCVVTDFCETIGLGIQPDFVVQRANESLTREACGLLLAYRRHGPPYGVGENEIKEQNQIITPLVGMNGSRLKVSGRLLELSPGEREDIAWMEKRLGHPLHENLKEDGTEISSENSLLTISRASCLEFARSFGECHDIPVPEELIPTDEVVSPQAAAEFIGACRTIWKTEDSRRKACKRNRPPFFSRIWRYLKKAPGRIARAIKGP